MNRIKPSIFFLSTGRCGTQWLQKTLAAVYPNEAVVTHEPVRGPYQPKVYLRAYKSLHELLDSDAVSKHLSSIKEIVRSKIYIETGWPCYPAIPLFIDQLAGGVRIVHLVRHPVPVALSLTTHRVYEQREDWVAGAAISPFDPGVRQKGLATDWDSLGMYEKCIFWWTEINMYALELQERHPGIEFLFVRYEDLFGPTLETLENIIRFMGLDYDPVVQEGISNIVDRYHWKSPPIDWKLIFKYPQTVSLAQRFGYDLSDFSSTHIASRYFNT